MTPVRHPVLQRLVAVLLFAGASAACVPQATASTMSEAAREQALRAALGDTEAVAHALEAARRAPTPSAAADAFVRTFTEATGDASAARDVSRLLLDHTGFGAPVAPRSDAVWTAPSGSTQILDRSLGTVVRLTAPSHRLVMDVALAPVPALDAGRDLEQSPQRTRAP